MKHKFLNTLILILLNILLVPIETIIVIGTMWYTLPLFKITHLGEYISSKINPIALFWIFIVNIVLIIIIIILEKILSKHSSTKVKNFFIHLNTILIALMGIICSIVTFIMADPLVATEVVIGVPRKISIGLSLLALVVFHVFSGKIKTIINRKLQAYDTALEMNDIGRSSIIGINILKLLELLFPEMLVLLLVCFCVSWNVASYFIVILGSCIIPIIGNIEADFNIRADIVRQKKIEGDLLAEKIAQNLKGQPNSNFSINTTQDYKEKLKAEKRLKKEQKLKAKLEKEKMKLENILKGE